MIFATILISAREWLLPAVGFLSVAILLLAWTYLRAPADKMLRTACAFLKLLGLAALLTCLLEPLWTTQRARPGANFLAVVADNSQGMGIKDRGEIKTRGAALTNLIAPQSGCLHQLARLDDVAILDCSEQVSVFDCAAIPSSSR